MLYILKLGHKNAFFKPYNIKAIMIPKNLIFSFLILLTYAQCPSNCQCESDTIACEICLMTYHQIFDQREKTCACLEGYDKFSGGGDHCCPLFCKKCYRKGCAECSQNAVLQWNNTVKSYDCVCKNNYYQVGLNCECLSRIVPNYYYFNPQLELCSICPNQCQCTQKGCIKCTNTTYRKIRLSFSGLAVCPCIYPTIQVSGQCECPQGCICSNSTIVRCNQQSKRIQAYSQWICPHPYKQQDGKCVCDQPYILIQVFGEWQCFCKSKINSSAYYQVESVCYSCGPFCQCSNRGCVRCIDSLRSKINYLYNCSCEQNAVFVNGQCACIKPYYLNQNGKCSCLSELQSMNYYINNTKCIVCPPGCLCNSSGCYQCNSSTLRVVNYHRPTKMFSCDCPASTQQKSGVCRCPDQYYFDNSSMKCVCYNQIYPAQAYHDNKGYCLVCPQLCLCDASGCFRCDNSSLRIVVTNQHFQKTCRCQSSLHEVEGFCVCPDNQVFNQEQNVCICKYPYFLKYIDDLGIKYCECRNTNQNQNYYEDHSLTCYECPKGCQCSQSGCHQCSIHALRFVDESDPKRKRCPCLQNTFQVDGICTLCPNSSYYSQGTCINCTLCKTCTFQKCLSCNQGMKLLNGTCICILQNLINIDGFCVCPFGKYEKQITRGQLDSNKTQCLICPPQCTSCKSINFVVRCLSCNTTNTNRLDVIQSQCPCKPGYIELSKKQTYCCHSFCLQCNQWGCISCPSNTFRSLLNHSCICKYPFQEKQSKLENKNNQISTNIVCQCSNGFYYFNQTCLNCPAQCATCKIDQILKIVVCVSCRQNSNRNLSTLSCLCNLGFRQNTPKTYYCSSVGCEVQQPFCPRCIDNRTLTKEGTCACPVGFYGQQLSCYKCVINGCLQCSSKLICEQCDQSNDYYLVQNMCLGINSDDFIMSQNHYGFTIQLRVKEIFEFRKVQCTVYALNKKQYVENNSRNTLRIDEILVQKNIINIIVQNPNIYYEDAIVSITFMNDSFGATPGQKLYTTINIHVISIVPQSIEDQFHSQKYKPIWSIVFLAISISLITALMGYKHNQIVSYLQSLTLVGMFLGSARFETVGFLYNLRFSLFKFNQKPIFGKKFFKIYLETSFGNFRWLTSDSNIIRMIDFMLISTIINYILFILLYVVYRLFMNKHILNTSMIQMKKRIFRVFEFFFKITMNPVIFFSIHTLMNIDAFVYFHRQFKYYSVGISIFFILLYGSSIYWMYYHGNISKLYRAELVGAFLFSIVNSILVLLAMKSDVGWLIMSIFLLYIKDMTYFVLKRIIRRGGNIFQVILRCMFSIQFAGTLSAMVPYVLIYYDLSNSAMAMVVVAIITMSLIQMKVIHEGKQKDKLQKIAPVLHQNPPSANELVIDQ